MRILNYILILMFFSSCSVRNHFAFFPDRETELPQEEIPPFVDERLIPTIDGERIQSFLLQHEGNSKKTLVIYFHGNAGNLYHRLPTAIELFNMNQDVLLVSYRGYAKSTGKPSESGIYTDGTSAIIYAMDSLGYKESDIVLMGRSIGTTVAVENAKNRNFKGVVLITPLTSGKEMAKAMGLGFLKFIAGNSFNSLAKINELKCKILIIHGTHDEVTPFEMGKKLYDAYEGEKEFITINYGKHNDLQDIDNTLYWKCIENFLRE